MTVVANPILCPDHFSEIIVDSAINPDVAEARGYRTLYGTTEDRAELTQIGFTKNITERDETYPALLVPMFRATGEIIAHQLKPGIPRTLMNGDGKPRAVKYENPKGSVNHLDVPEFTRSRLGDVAVPLWFTEGVKKVDALVSQGIASVGLTGVYNWRSKLGSLGDWEDIPIKGRDAVICFDADAKENRNVQLAMRRFGAWLESKGARKVFYLIVPAEHDGTSVKGVDDWFAANGDLGGLQQVATLTAPGDGPKDASFTDAILTDTVCEDSLEGRFCWARGLGWMSWDGHVWNEVADTAPTEAVRLWAIDQFQKTLSEQKTDPSRDRGGEISGWRSVLSKGRIKALVNLARGVLEEDAARFDADPDLLCVKNGYVDLRTGRLYGPDPEKLMTKSCNADYVPDARHPMWDKALEAIPADVLPWYQDRMGQAITGYMTPDDLMVIAHGDGSNGKSTVVNAVQRTLGTGHGSYGVLLSDRVLLASPDAHTTELMDLRGARYAILDETPEARRLDVHRLKKTVGTEQITARRIRQDGVTFDATHSLFVNTNFRPVVTETDHGTWRRLALLTFPYTYRKPSEPLYGPLDRSGDPGLRDAANRDERFRQAVLSWLVNGARAWFERDRTMLPLPERVEADTMAWRGETDLILGFAAECLRFVAEGRTSAREMLAAFNAWTEGQGHKPWTEKTFAGRFGAHETVKRHRVEKKRVRLDGLESHPVMTWLGVTLSDGNPESPFSPPKGTDPAPDNEPDQRGVQGVQASLVTAKSNPYARVTGGPCTPCTPQVRSLPAAPVNRDAETHMEQNGHETEEDVVTLHTDPAQPPITPAPTTHCEENPGKEHESDAEPTVSPAPAEEPLGVLWTNGLDGPPSLLQTDAVRPEGAPVGFDLETRGIDLFRAGPGFVTLSGYGNRVDASPEALCARMRAGETWVGHGVHRFDLPALERHHGLRIEETWGRVRCTQLQAMIADPPTSEETEQGPHFKSYSLDAVSERVLGEPKDERGKLLAAEYCTTPRCTHGRSSKCNGWENIPADDPRYAQYCADDVHRAERVHDTIGWTDYMEREMKLQSVMSRMTLNGFRVDAGLLDERIREGEKRKSNAVRELAERFGMPTERVKETRNGPKVTTFKSPLATSEGKAWLDGVYKTYGVTRPPRTEKSGDLATSAEALKSIAEHPRCPEDLRRILNLMSVVTSERTIYGTIRDSLVGDRVHMDIWPSQASGRWSAGFLTTMGKRGNGLQERAVFLPEPDHSIICVDLGQIDARIVAAHAQDPNYLALFAPGKDLHTEIALQFFGSTEYRDKGKPITHSSNYGVGRNKLIKMGNDPKIVDAYFKGRAENFPGLLRWTDEVRSIGESGQLLDNGFGRMIRVNPRFAYTQAPAGIGQGGTRDMMGQCLLDLVDAEPRVLPMLRAIVHDEIVLSVPTEEADEIGRFVVRTFEREWAPPGKELRVPVIADASRPGVNWADAYRK